MENARQTKQKQTLAMLLAALGNMIFGFSFLFSKAAFGLTSVRVTPFLLLSHRFLLAFAVMNILRLIGVGTVRLKGKPVGKLLLLGLLQPVLYFIFENYALKDTESYFSAILLSLIPAATMVCGFAFLKEKIS
ncbi:MAG: DMT family transporter, partial [Clostridia bacterium]|nr:DMT family transporter [Clostridia bacterium]